MIDWQTLYQHAVLALASLGGVGLLFYIIGRAYEAGKIHAHQHAQNIVNNAIQQGRNLEKAEQQQRQGGGE